MKILVTGGCGFIGSHVVDILIGAGHETVVVDDLSTGHLDNLNAQAKFYEMDFSSPELRDVIAAEQPDVIDHHAAQMDVRRSVADPVFDAELNIMGPIRMLELAREFGVGKIIHISSGGTVYGEPQYLPCDESHPIQPLSPYGASKFTFELYVQMYHKLYGLDYAVLRYPNVYGPRQDPHGEAGVVAIFAGQMLADEPVVIFGDGEQSRDFVYVADVASANLTLIEQKVSGTYNLGYGEGTTVNEVYGTLKELTHYDQEAEYAPPRPGEISKIYLAAQMAHEDFGWKPAYDLKSGLQATVDFFRSTMQNAEASEV